MIALSLRAIFWLYVFYRFCSFFDEKEPSSGWTSATCYRRPLGHPMDSAIPSSSEKALSGYEKPLEPGYHDLSESVLLKISAAELQSLLEAETLTSERLVGVYLDQMDRHNHKGARLHAVISTMARQKAVQVARKLDKERLRRKREEIPRGPLYGIPIIIKVPCQHSVRWELRIADSKN